MEVITYGAPAMLGKSQVTGVGAILTSETTILTLTDQTNIGSNDGKISWKSQLTFFIKVLFGGSTTGIQFRYYFTPDGTNWFPLPTRAAATGILTDLPSEITSATFSDGTSYYAIDEVPMPACVGLKVTATAVGAAATLQSFLAMGRDN